MNCSTKNLRSGGAGKTDEPRPRRCAFVRARRRRASGVGPWRRDGRPGSRSRSRPGRGEGQPGSSNPVAGSCHVLAARQYHEPLWPLTRTQR